MLTINSSVSICDASSTTSRSTGMKRNIPQLSIAGLDNIDIVHRMTEDEPSMRLTSAAPARSWSERMKRPVSFLYRCSCLCGMSANKTSKYSEQVIAPSDVELF